MATLTVRNIPDEAKHRFRQVAAAHGRSMEEHLRQLVIEADHEAVVQPTGVTDVTRPFGHFTADPAAPSRARSRARIERLIELGRGLDFELPPREVGTIKDVDFS